MTNTLQTFTGDKLLMNKTKLSWLWPGRIPKGFVSLLAAEGGIGKSGLSLWLADKFAGEGYKVVYVDAESCGMHIAERIRQWNLPHAGLIHFTGNLRPNGDLETSAKGTISSLVRTLVKAQPDIVIMDSLTKLGSEYDLNQMKNVSEFYGLMEDLTNEGAAILLIAHLRKQPPGDTPDITNAAVSGSAALVNLARSVMLLQQDKDDPDLRTLIHTKCNMARLADNLFFRMNEHGVSDMRTSPRMRKVSKGTKIDSLRTLAMNLIREGNTNKKEITAAMKDAGASNTEVGRVYAWMKETQSIII